MKHCKTCGLKYANGIDRCPRDGTPLSADPQPTREEGTAPPERGLPPEDREPFHAETVTLESEPDVLPAGTAEIAQEIEDLIFKVCTHCHSTFGGPLEVCPADGTKLLEHSMLNHPTMALEAGGDAPPLKKYCPRCRQHFDLNVKACEQCGTALAIPTFGGGGGTRPRAAELGLVIADKYRLLEDIGAGGFGSVFLAKHEALGKRYAVKMLRSRLSDATDFRNRFHEEALKLSRLEDENIVKVIDFGESEQGQYMVTEYVEGQELGSLIYGERMAPLRAARIMKQVASALAEAHAKKIVHLDLKPSNVLVSQKRGRDLVKIIDFGIAEMYSEAAAKRQETVVGTCTYMAPEQWRQEPLDPRTDIYSFGVIFYEFLAGRPPFRHHKISALKRAHCETPPEPLRKQRADTPVDIERLVLRSLEKDPAKRFQSAEEIEAALDAHIRRSENVFAARLRRAAIIVAVVGLAALGAWGGWDAFIRDKEGPRFEEDWAPTDRDAAPLQRLPDEGATRRYVTAAEEVVIPLRAVDDRRVDHYLAAFPPREYERIPPDREEIRFSPDRGQVVSLMVVALDPSGNRSKPLSLQVERLRDPLLVVGPPFPPTHTRDLHTRVNIEQLQDGTAVLTVRNGGEEIDRREIAKAGPVDLLRLREGKNLIEIRSIDALTGKPREVPEKSYPVSVKTQRPVLKATLKLEPREGRYVSKEEEVLIDVKIEEASERFAGGKTAIRYEVNKQSGYLPLAEGAGELKVRLTKEGPNTIALVSDPDLHGLATDEKTWTVDLDTKPPKLTISTPSLDVYSDQRPKIRLGVSDDHPGPDPPRIYLLQEDGERPLDPTSLTWEPVGNGEWDLTFGQDVLAKEGIYRFRAQATDQLGWETGREVELITVRVDRNRPEVRIRAPRAGSAFKGGQEVVLEVDVRDAFLQDVVAVVSAKAPGVDVEKQFRMYPIDPPQNMIWRAEIRLGEEGIEKPTVFDQHEPGFSVAVIARDEFAAKASDSHQTREILDLRFAWEIGDRLLRPLPAGGASLKLVYHEAPGSETGGFWIGETEVTNAQYACYPAAAEKANRNSADELDLPVRGLTPDEAGAFATWAKLALPTLDEWRVAALWDHKKQAPRMYPWGDAWPPGQAHPVWAGKGEDGSPVAAACAEGDLAMGKTPAPFGLLHMFGNVWEYVRDEKQGRVTSVGGCFRTSYRYFTDLLKRSDVQDWLLRGGADRVKEVKMDEVGFRCILRERREP